MNLTFMEFGEHKVETSPFPHVVIDRFFPDSLIADVAEQVEFIVESSWIKAEIPDLRGNLVEVKDSIPFDFCKGIPLLGAMHEALSSPEFTAWVGKILKIENLQFDTLGGGLHRIRPGGLLNPHLDFNVDKKGRWRRANALLYLGPANGGELILFHPDGLIAKVIEPKRNRLVIFECSETSWHGHPVALGPGPNRKSLAAYYFTNEKPEGAAEPHETIFRVWE